jgi:uncharacterized protein
MNFEYNDDKSRLNKEKHGIDFDKAQNIWLDDNVIVPALTEDEIRYMIIGKIEGKFYSCIYTERSDKIRLISCRRSRDNEKKVYHEKSK